MDHFNLSEQTWKMRDGEGGCYVVRHLFIATEHQCAVAWHWPAPVETSESVRIGGPGNEYATPGAAFAACLEHLAARKLASIDPSNIDADGRHVEAAP